MSDAPEATGQANKTKSLNELIGPIMISAVVEVLVSSIKSLPPDQRMLIIVVLGFMYTLITSRSKGRGGLTVSRRATIVLTVLFIMAIILVLLAYLILNLDPVQALTLIVWLVLMMAILFISRTLPDSQVFLKSLLANVAAFSLGGGLAIGGAPVIKLVLSLAGLAPTFLIIQNNCSDPMVNQSWGLDVQAFGSKAVPVPAISFTLEREKGVLLAKAVQRQASIPLSDCIDLRIDGKTLLPGNSVNLDFQDERNHTVIKDCITGRGAC
jgi:hypothetical protein